MEEPLRADEIDAYQRKLNELFDALVGKVDSVSRATLEPSGDPEQQPSDENVEEVGFGSNYEPLAAEDELGYRVRNALRRIVEGTYGACERCGRPIGRERLDEVPYAAECVECARLSESETGAAREIDR
jgi:DnaK suppressor protein